MRSGSWGSMPEDGNEHLCMQSPPLPTFPQQNDDALIASVRAAQSYQHKIIGSHWKTSTCCPIFQSIAATKIGCGGFSLRAGIGERECIENYRAEHHCYSIHKLWMRMDKAILQMSCEDPSSQKNIKLIVINIKVLMATRRVLTFFNDRCRYEYEVKEYLNGTS